MNQSNHPLATKLSSLNIGPHILKTYRQEFVLLQKKCTKYDSRNDPDIKGVEALIDYARRTVDSPTILHGKPFIGFREGLLRLLIHGKG